MTSETHPPETPRPAPGLLVAGHFRERLPYHVLRRQGTQDWLLTFTLRGRGLYRQPGLRVEVEPGDLALLEPDAWHDYGCLPGKVWDFVWAHFIARPAWLEHLTLPPEGRGLKRQHIADPATRGRLRGAFLRVLGDSRSGSGGLNEELALNALEEVFLLAARERALATRGRWLSPEIRRCVERLAERLAEPHALADLARGAGLSPSRFAHRFKAETGDSAIAYLLKLRLRQGARLLEFSGRSVKEVAREVGFESPFYFSRLFRRHFRMSPREYQRRGR